MDKNIHEINEVDNNKNENITKAVEQIKKSKYVIAFTGAGVSVESGIPPFRGEGGLYEKVSENVFDLDYFYAKNKDCWYMLVKHIFIPLLKAKPNLAHIALSEIEKKGILKAVITQNIDTLHEKAGSNNIIKFHGSIDIFKCTKCMKIYRFEQVIGESTLNLLKDDKNDVIIDKNIFEKFEVPRCKSCGAIIKPDIVFFKEPIPEKALNESFNHAQNSDCLIIIGTSGVVYPAAMIPQIVHRNKGKIIEINKEPSEYTNTITDIFLQGNASEILHNIQNLLN